MIQIDKEEREWGTLGAMPLSTKRRCNIGIDILQFLWKVKDERTSILSHKHAYLHEFYWLSIISYVIIVKLFSLCTSAFICVISPSYEAVLRIKQDYACIIPNTSLWHTPGSQIMTTITIILI